MSSHKKKNAGSVSRVSAVSLASTALLSGCVGLTCRTPVAPVSIHAETLGGKQAYVLENGIYRTILVPEIARFPVSLVFKATGHDCFAQPEPLDTPNDDFRYYGGIVDCLPWVSGKTESGEKLQNKGCLYSVPWHCTTGGDDKEAWFEGTAEIAYTEPIGQATNRLRYVKRVTGQSGSPDIRMEQTILNIGTTPARFLMTLHARTSIAGYNKGDYLYVPGTRATISYMTYPALTERGLVPGKETAWPIPEAVEFQPSKNPWHVFVFTPADWAVAGDDMTGEALVFKGGTVSVPGQERKVKTGLFMTNAGYLLEPGLTSCIDATPENWANPENMIRLEPGQTCTFSITLTPRSGVHRKDWPQAK